MRAISNHSSISGPGILLLSFINAIILETAFTQDERYYLLLIVTAPLFLLAIFKKREKNHARPVIPKGPPTGENSLLQ